MPQVEVGKIRDGGTGTPSGTGELETKLFERIRNRAFELFEERLDGPGSRVNDRMKTGQNLIGAAEADFREQNGALEIQIAFPGFDAKDIQVVASANGMIVQAMTTHKHETDDGNGYFCEFGQRQMFRQFNLPKQIDVESVAAKLEKGTLRINAAYKEVQARSLAAAAEGNGASSARMERAMPAAGEKKLMELVGQYSPILTFNENTTLDDLGISSLERLMLTMEIEQQLGILISDSELGALRTLGELAKIARASVQDSMPEWGGRTS